MKKMFALMIAITGLGMAPLFLMGWAGALSLSGCVEKQTKTTTRNAVIHSKAFLEKPIMTKTPTTLEEAQTMIDILRRQVIDLTALISEVDASVRGPDANAATEAIAGKPTTTQNNTPAVQPVISTTTSAAKPKEK